MTLHPVRAIRSLAVACSLGASLTAFNAAAGAGHSQHTDKAEFVYVVNDGSNDIFRLQHGHGHGRAQFRHWFAL